MGDGLRDQHSVEGVAVGTGQGASLDRVLQGYWQPLEVLVGDGPGNIERERDCAGNPSKSMLCRDLPGGRRADQYVVRFILNGTAGRL